MAIDLSRVSYVEREKTEQYENALEVQRVYYGGGAGWTGPYLGTILTWQGDKELYYTVAWENDQLWNHRFCGKRYYFLEQLVEKLIKAKLQL